MRLPIRIFGILDFPYAKLGIRDFKAKSAVQDSGLKICAQDGMPKINIGIAGLQEILGSG